MNEVLNVKVERLTRLKDNGGCLKAHCDLLFGDLFLVKGFKVIKGEKGSFVGMPQAQNKQGKWYSVFTATTKEVKDYLQEVVLDAYKNEVE